MSNRGQEHYIIDKILDEVHIETVRKYGPTNKDTAKKIIFKIYDLLDGGTTFRAAKSIAINRIKIAPAFQRQFHSLVTKYFKRVAAKRITDKLIADKQQSQKRRGLYRSSTALVTPMMSTEWGKKIE